MMRVRENFEPLANVHSSLLVTESVQPAPPAAASSQVVVDAEGNGTITVEVPNVDHSEVKRKMDSDVGPAKIDIARPIKLLKTPPDFMSLFQEFGELPLPGGSS